MSGKPYTMKEMRAIVAYLVEHKAYGETKARKMWIDMQDSKITNRTWQSLKETFLKRILPDIHNPYYKLSLEQISSFKQGYDIEKRLNNKLEFEATSESNTDDNNQENKEDPVLNKNEDKPGEDIGKSKSDLRASIETLVLGPLDLEDKEPSPAEDPVKEPVKETKKNKKYSDPLIPILQAVMDDFNTSEEDNDEPRMQIVEAEPLTNVQESTRIEHSDLPIVHQDNDKDLIDLTEEKNNEPSQTLTKRDVSNNDVKEIETSTNKDSKSSNEVIENNLLTENSKTPNKITQNGSNSTTDTFIPDNQEALEDKTNEGISKPSKTNGSNRSKRRASSQGNSSSSSLNKKRLLSTDKKYTSDMDTVTKKKRNLSLKKLNPVSKIQDLGEQSKNAKSQTDVDNNRVQTNGNDASNETFKVTQPSDIEAASANTVSLQAGQGSNRKSSNRFSIDSVNSGIHKKSKDKVENKDLATSLISRNSNDVVVLASHSGSQSEEDIGKREKGNVVQRERERAVAKMFGFTSGAVSRTRKRRHSHRKSRNHIQMDLSSESSAWTSEEDSEYVSPPRGRKNRRARKYLKPNSARVLAFEENGGLFVFYGKKIYPLVKDGKIVKNYVNLMEEDDDDQEEAYWKLKYTELKQKHEELTKLNLEANGKNDQESKVIPVSSSNVTTPTDCTSIGNGTAKAVDSDPVAVTPSDRNNAEPSKNKLKLKFTVNNAEVELEGSSSQVNPMLELVMQQLLHKPQENAQPKASSKPESETSSMKSSDVVVVSDQEARERVERLENDIFKQIQSERVSEEKESKTNDIVAPVNPSEKNVTVRKTKAKKQSTSPKGRTPAKKPVSEVPELKSNENKPPKRRSTRAARQSLEDKTQEPGNAVSRKRQSTSEENDEDKDNRYKFPSPQPSKRKSYTNKNKRQKSNRSANLCFPPENASHGSKANNLVSSIYDPSVIPLSITKKINATYTVPKTFTVSKLKPKKLFKKQTLQPNITDDISSDSSNSFQGSIKSLTFQNSSLNSNVYKSESYELLMNNVTVRKKTKKCPSLNIIDEASLSHDQDSFNLFDLDNTDIRDAINHTNTDTSSNNTMPTSPILSIVENISIGNHLDNFDFEEPEYISHQKETDQVFNNPEAHGDVSMPLMQLDSAIHSGIHEDNEDHFNLDGPETPITVSLVKKVNTVEIGNTIFTESINNKLQNLVLESNKKKRNDDSNSEKNTKEQNNSEVKMVKTKRRSSTPLKRQNKRKTKKINSEPCIEEERMETCSQRHLKACPIKLLNVIDIHNNNVDSIPIEPDIDKAKKGVAKKKNVIKVKITKPKRISKSMECIQNAVDRDSGINDIGASHFLSVDNEDIALTHNHSDTCINPDECFGNSIEIIEDPTKSIVSVESSHLSIDDECVNQPVFMSDSHCQNTEDGSKIPKVIVNEVANKQDSDSRSYKTAMGSPDSLITEDLSSESSPKPARAQTDWFLVSEEDTTNASDLNYYGGHLNKIFPITCAIPNLSTITEISKENTNHNSRKSNEETQPKNEQNFKGLFDI